MADNLDIHVSELGLRGENFADVARRVGSIAGVAVAPSATDAEVLEALADSQADALDPIRDEAVDAAADSLAAQVATEAALTQALAAVERRLYHSVRFHRENGEEAESGYNGQLYVPNSNRIFKTTVDFDTPMFTVAEEDAIAIMGSIPLERYKHLNRSPQIIGTGGATNSRTLNLGYIPGGHSDTANRGKFWFKMYGENAGGAWGNVYSAAMPSDFSGHFLAVVRTNASFELVLDILDTKSMVWTHSTPVAKPGSWAGIGRLTNNITVGGRGDLTFPYDYDQTFGRQGLPSWHGDAAHLLFVDGVTTDAQWEAIAAGATIATELGAGNLRLHCPLANAGALDLSITSNMAAYTDTDMVQQGTVYPGSTPCRQATAKYLTIDRVPDPCLISRERNADVAIMQHSGEYAGLTGFLQARIIDETSHFVKDWHTVGKHADFSGGVWTATVWYPKWDKQVSVQFRFTSDIAVIASINSEMWVGQGVVVWGQSEPFYSTAYSLSVTGNNTTLNVRPERDAGRSVFMVGPTTTSSSIKCSELTPGLLGDEFVTIMNHIRGKTNEPVFVILQVFSGTSALDLIDDSLLTRQWADDQANWEQMGNRGPDGEIVVSAHVWGGWEAYAAGDLVIPPVHFPPIFWGVATSAVAQSAIDHYFYDGTFSLSAKKIVLPNNRAMTWTTQASDRNGEADQRDGFRAYADTYGYEIAPETTTHEMEALSGNVTHPKTASLEGSVEMARAFGEAICMGIGVGTYEGPAFFTSAAFVAGSGNLEVDVTLTAPAFGPGGFLVTKGGGPDVTGFEAKLSNAGSWSRANILSAEILNPYTVRLTLASAGTDDETFVSHMSGAPGNYSSTGSGDAAWRAGTLLFNGWPVAGGNTPIAVA
jgi:hypothetical protein